MTWTFDGTAPTFDAGTSGGFTFDGAGAGSSTGAGATTEAADIGVGVGLSVTFSNGVGTPTELPDIPAGVGILGGDGFGAVTEFADFCQAIGTGVAPTPPVVVVPGNGTIYPRISRRQTMNVPAANVTNTSGTYAFAPSMGETVLYAYGLCGIRNTALTQQHFETARMACNMILGRWSSDGVNLWQVDLQCIPLVQGQATYPVPSNTIVMLDGYYTISNGVTEIDRIMMPVSRTEYASYSNKQVQGAPTVFWFDRLLSPTVTLYQTPNGQQATFKYYRLRQTQDGNLTNGSNLEIPYYFMDAFAFALAYRLALAWAPTQAPILKPLADEAWAIASKQNVESGSFYISPTIGPYFRQ